MKKLDSRKIALTASLTALTALAMSFTVFLLVVACTSENRAVSESGCHCMDDKAL